MLDPEAVIFNSDVTALAEKYVEEKIIPGHFHDDALRIAAVTYADCDAFISWNFKHMVRFKTIRGVNAVNQLLNYRQIEILTAQSWVEEDRDE